MKRLMVVLLVLAGCSTQRTEMRCEKIDSNNDIYIGGERFHVEAGYGQRANEVDGVRPDANKDHIDGLGVYREGGFFVLKWSVPVTNNVSPMQAVAKAQVTVGCAYPTGNATYKDEGTTDVEPGQTRLITGTIKVPVTDVAATMREIANPSILFPYFQYATQMDGIAFEGSNLKFDYLGTKDGEASARWQAIATRITMKAVVTAEHAAPATLDTSKMVGTATCRVYDKDGKLLKEDVVAVASSGTITATGFIRMPAELWKTVDWKKAVVVWKFE